MSNRVPVSKLPKMVRDDVTRCEDCYTIVNTSQPGELLAILCGWHESLTAGALLVEQLYDGPGYP